ncbi:MAG: hypothetical protein ACRCSW_13020 [Tabrizicola sp.]
MSLPIAAHADDDACRNDRCPTSVSFTSISDTRSYGLLIAAPDAGCHHVRFRIEGPGAVFLGHTPPLAPGELAVVRMGRGFPEGEHVVTIASIGCATHPSATRRVTFAKAAPDHGWRAVGD